MLSATNEGPLGSSGHCVDTPIDCQLPRHQAKQEKERPSRKNIKTSGISRANSIDLGYSVSAQSPRAHSGRTDNLHSSETLLKKVLHTWVL